MKRVSRVWRGLSAYILLLGGWLLLAVAARGHGLTVTRVEASFVVRGRLDVIIEIDLSPMLDSADAYYELAQASRPEQATRIAALQGPIQTALQLYIGNERLILAPQGFALPRLSRTDFSDPAQDKFTTLLYTAVLPVSGEPIFLLVPPGARLEHPVGLTVHVPAAHYTTTCWLEDESGESDRIDWQAVLPARLRPAAAPRRDGAP